MKFLNCNYPNKFKIPKGKPKCLSKARFSMKLDGTTLIEEKKGIVWFNIAKGYYYGIELDLKYNSFGIIRKIETVNAINAEMLNWVGTELNNTGRELLLKYLKLL